MTNIAESYPPPPKNFPPTPRSPNIFGRSWHPFLSKSVEICFF